MRIGLDNPRFWGRALAAVAWVCSLRALAAEVLAPAGEGGSPVTAAQSRVVVLIGSASPDAVELDFLPNLRWQLAELNLTLKEKTAPVLYEWLDYVREAERVTSTSDTFVAAWITHENGRTNIYLYDPKGPHLYAREVAVSESPAAASEELALILRSAIQARLDGGALAMAEITLPSSAPLAPPEVHQPPPPPVPFHEVSESINPLWAPGVSGVASRPLSGSNWQAGLLLRLWAKVRPIRFGLSYSMFPGLDASSKWASITVYRHPTEVFAGYEIARGSVIVVAESAFCGDPIRRDTTYADAPLTGEGPRWRWLWTLSERMRFETRLVSPLWLTVAAGAEIPLNPYDFQVSIAEQKQTLARILPVRPTLELGLVLGFR